MTETREKDQGLQAVPAGEGGSPSGQGKGPETGHRPGSLCSAASHFHPWCLGAS